MMKKGRSKLTNGNIDYHFKSSIGIHILKMENQLRNQKTKRDSGLNSFVNDQYSELEEFYLDLTVKLLNEKDRIAHPTTTSTHYLSTEFGSEGT